MSTILPFDPEGQKKKKATRLKEKARQRTLCSNNHHKWKTVTESKFDVKEGRLVTVEQCDRCGLTRNRLT